MSNVRTGVVGAIAEHPIRDYFERRLTVSVNTDDPEMFGTSLTAEYRMLERERGFSRREICCLTLLGVQSSWLPDDDKAVLAASFEEDPTWVQR